MTANQIAYQRMLEEKRSNRVQEAETARHQQAMDYETNRHNVQTEQLGMLNFGETQRHNVQQEYLTGEQNAIRWGELAELKRSNAAKEAETNRHNLTTESETAFNNRITEALKSRENDIKSEQIYVNQEIEEGKLALQQRAQGWKETTEKVGLTISAINSGIARKNAETNAGYLALEQEYQPYRIYAGVAAAESGSFLNYAKGILSAAQAGGAILSGGLSGGSEIGAIGFMR